MKNKTYIKTPKKENTTTSLSNSKFDESLSLNNI